MGLAPLLAAVVLAVSPVSFVQSHAVERRVCRGGRIVGRAAHVVGGARAARGRRRLARLARVPAGAGGDRSRPRTTSRSSRSRSRRSATGTPSLLARLHVQPNGQIGETLNSTYWGVLALGRSSPATTRFMLAQQTKAGGFAWYRHGQADSNDTAAALEALRVAGVHGAPVTRAVAVPAHVSAARRRLRAHARPRLRRAVHGVGDPGARRRGPEAAAERVRLPGEAEARPTGATATRRSTRRRRCGSRRRCWRRWRRSRSSEA